jgi:bifunctional UDP-N-acetylglucosamine pyrophosphorylase/glucosamine-1-phosphate N-acetyltransferase
LCGDVPFLTSDTIDKFIFNHNSENRDVSVLSTFADNPKGYGRILRDEKNNFTSIVEEKDTNDLQKSINEVNSGIYYLKSEILFDLLQNVKNNNNQNEFYLTDIISIGLNRGLNIAAFPLAKFDELQGINTQDELQKAEELIKNSAI